jgi:hypothetical protein
MQEFVEQLFQIVHFIFQIYRALEKEVFFKLVLHYGFPKKHI